MVDSIRYWVQATRIVERTPAGLQPSALGTAIFGEDGRVPLEDALDSPLSLLGLVRPVPDGHRHRCAAEERDGPPDGVFGYAVADLFNAIGLSTLPITELMYGRAGFPAIGACFRLTENVLLTKLERMIRRLPGRFALREQAGIQPSIACATRSTPWIRCEARIATAAVGLITAPTHADAIVRNAVPTGRAMLRALSAIM